MSGELMDDLEVAPHAGAWIEIHVPNNIIAISLSRPTRARGLKSDDVRLILLGGRSRPTRARGLKYATAPFHLMQITSRPTRARGLKCWTLG